MERIRAGSLAGSLPFSAWATLFSQPLPGLRPLQKHAFLSILFHSVLSQGILQ
jgi:hypothetical protein